MHKRTIIALGGNALQGKGERGAYEEQELHAVDTMRSLLPLFGDLDNEIVITHGSGPQIGSILLQNEAACNEALPMPMFVCDAMAQGEIGFMLEQALRNVLAAQGITREAATLITKVVVDPKDPAFLKPSKPVGVFHSEEHAGQLSKTTGYLFKEDAGRGWRRVVPSPEPLAIVEIEAIKELLRKGMVVIAGGGGGIPVWYEQRVIKGVDAVIDKDKAAALIADSVEADLLIILTGVEKVLLRFGKPGEKPLSQLSVADARRYIVEGQFAEGSMKPKIEAAVQFVSKDPTRKALITHARVLREALEGKNGTWITG